MTTTTRLHYAIEIRGAQYTSSDVTYHSFASVAERDSWVASVPNDALATLHRDVAYMIQDAGLRAAIEHGTVVAHHAEATGDV